MNKTPQGARFGRALPSFRCSPAITSILLPSKTYRNFRTVLLERSRLPISTVSHLWQGGASPPNTHGGVMSGVRDSLGISSTQQNQPPLGGISRGASGI